MNMRYISIVDAFIVSMFANSHHRLASLLLSSDRNQGILKTRAFPLSQESGGSEHHAYVLHSQ
jgi:hypothetical protein